MAVSSDLGLTFLRSGCVWLGMVFAVAVHAQSLRPAADTGLRLEPDATSVFYLPVYGNWGVQSTIRGPYGQASEGLKLGLAGIYGWDFRGDTRLALGAGLVSSDRSTGLPANSIGIRSSPAGGALLGTDRRDMNFNLALDWRYSNAITLYSGLGLSYSLVDSVTPGLQTLVRPASSSGFIGLKYRF